MSVSALANSSSSSAHDHAVAAGASAYGSLMGLAGSRKKKKPVLVLDDDELEKAHMAIAMGGAQIMEAGDLPMEDRPTPRPAIKLGLVPMGSAPEPEELPTAADDEVQEWTSPSETSPSETSLPEIGMPEEDYLAPEDTQYVQPEFAEEQELDAEAEDELEEEEGPDLNLNRLLRPSRSMPLDEAERENALPSIEEQMARMRALPSQDFGAAEESAEPLFIEPVDASFAPEPEPEFDAETEFEVEAEFEPELESEAEAEVEFEDEAEEELEEEGVPALNLTRLLATSTSAAPMGEAERERSLPSIHEQMARMRALPAQDSEVAEELPAPASIMPVEAAFTPEAEDAPETEFEAGPEALWEAELDGEDEAEDELEEAEGPDLNLSEFLRPSRGMPLDEAERERSLPSIHEQMARMRAMPSEEAGTAEELPAPIEPVEATFAPEVEDQPEAAFADEFEAEIEDELEAEGPDLNLEHILGSTGNAPLDEAERESTLPSIEEQISRMRALPMPSFDTAEDIPAPIDPVEATWFDAEPEPTSEIEAEAEIELEAEAGFEAEIEAEATTEFEAEQAQEIAPMVEFESEPEAAFEPEASFEPKTEFEPETAFEPEPEVEPAFEAVIEAESEAGPEAEAEASILAEHEAEDEPAPAESFSRLDIDDWSSPQAGEEAGHGELDSEPVSEPEQEHEFASFDEQSAEALPDGEADADAEMLGEAAQDAPDHVEAEFEHEADGGDGPDLSWMHPDRPRSLDIGGGNHSQLRARLIRSGDADVADESRNLLQVIWDWIARLWR